MVSVRTGCINYFRGFQELAKIQENSSKDTVLAIFKILSYPTLLVPLVFGIAYGVSSYSLKGRLKKQNDLKNQSRISEIGTKKLRTDGTQKKERKNKPHSTSDVSPKDLGDITNKSINKNAEVVFQAGNRCYADEEYDKAATLYEEAGKLGSLEAYTRLGKMYYLGIGVAKDEAKALKFYSKNPDAESHTAQSRIQLFHLKKAVRALEQLHDPTLGNEISTIYSKIGDLYYDEDVPDSMLKESTINAIENYEKAALHENPNALYMLGWIYAAGIGDITEDLPKAVGYYERALATDHENASLGLGRIYARGGEGVKKDLPKAIHYFELAARYGSEEASEKLKMIN